MNSQDSISAREFACAALARARAGARVVSAVVVSATDASRIGLRKWWTIDEAEGFLGGGLLERAVDRRASALVRSAARLPATEALRSARDGRGEEVEVYFESLGPRPLLVIVGAGHIAVPMARIGAMLEMDVRVLDDRPEFVVPERFPGAGEVRRIDFHDPFRGVPLDASSHILLVTRGHRYDYECLLKLLAMPARCAYIGMIGSRRRVRATCEALRRDGVSPEAMRTVRAPVGLDLGGQAPAEIAVAVAAEIVLLRRGGTGAPLLEKEKIVDRFFRDAPKEIPMEPRAANAHQGRGR